MTLRLRTFGSVYLTKDGSLLTGPAGQRRLLALLTVVAAAGERGISRDKVLALLWSEGEPEKSRHALTQALYHTRKALGADNVFLNGPDLRVNPDVLSSDLSDFQRAFDAGRLEDAADLYSGAFLDGFYLNGDPGFDFWVSSERDRLARQYGELVSTLADRAAAARDLVAERRWRERLVDHDPLNGAAIARLMACVIAVGDDSAALQYARADEAQMRSELDLPPDGCVTDLVAAPFVVENPHPTSASFRTSSLPISRSTSETARPPRRQRRAARARSTRASRANTDSRRASHGAR